MSRLVFFFEKALYKVKESVGGPYFGHRIKINL